MKRNVEIFAILLASLSVFVTGSSLTCMTLLTETMKKLDIENSVFLSEEQLTGVCPAFQNFAECFTKFLKDDPDAAGDDTLKYFRIFESVLESLCTENSTLRKNYLDQVVCLRRSEEVYPFCEQMSKHVYNFYVYTSKLKEEEPLPEERSCFEEGFTTGCMSDFVQENCGRRDLATFQFFVSKYLAAVCNPEAAEALRTKFLNSMYFERLDDEKRKIYEDTFNLAGSA